MGKNDFAWDNIAGSFDVATVQAANVVQVGRRSAGCQKGQRESDAQPETTTCEEESPELAPR